jgi:hypothetical protein
MPKTKHTGKYDLKSYPCLCVPILLELSIADRKYSGLCALCVVACLGMRRYAVPFVDCPVYYLTFRRSVIII